jgi:hypothetical protein
MNRKRHKHKNYEEYREWTIQGDGEKDFYLPKYIDKPLQFARKHAKWQHIGREYIFRHAMTQVNKDAKADIKPYSDKFYEWITTMYAMLPVHDYEYRRNMEQELSNYMADNHLRYDNRIEEYKKIIRDDNHPMRLHLAVEYLSHSPLYGYRGVIPIETKEKASKVRSNWNRWLNKTLGLSKNIHEARTEEVK